VGGYKAAKKVYMEMTPEAVCRDMIDAGLRGRGGGGFPTGKKWDVARVQNNPKKYVICNGDEGDPGAFMDRAVMEGNPHAVIEGMMIAGRAIGADEGYVYVRAEYPLAVARIRKACADALQAGILGDKVFGTEMAFKLRLWLQFKASAGCRRPNRRSRRRVVCGASRPSSTMWKRWRPCL
jgi:NADH-quinone oxidoreductase subunit F